MHNYRWRHDDKLMRPMGGRRVLERPEEAGEMEMMPPLLSSCLTLSLFPFLSHSVCLCPCLFVLLQVFVRLSFTPSMSNYLVFLSVFQSICLSLRLSIAVCLCLSLSVRLSRYVFLCLSISVSVSLCFSLSLYFCLSLSVFVCLCLSLSVSTGWVRRVVGTIWNVGACNPSSLPLRNANSGKPLKVD